MKMQRIYVSLGLQLPIVAAAAELMLGVWLSPPCLVVIWDTIFTHTPHQPNKLTSANKGWTFAIGVLCALLLPQMAVAIQFKWIGRARLESANERHARHVECDGNDTAISVLLLSNFPSPVVNSAFQHLRKALRYQNCRSYRHLDPGENERVVDKAYNVLFNLVIGTSKTNSSQKKK